MVGAQNDATNYSSLAAHLAAANCFTVDHLHRPESARHVANAQIFYIEGYHLTVCPPAIMHLAQHSHDHGKTFAMNLSAPFICEHFKAPFDAALPFIDILFGNDSEAKAFAHSHGWPTDDMTAIAVRLAELPKENAAKPRMAIVTQVTSWSFAWLKNFRAKTTSFACTAAR